MKYLRLYRFRPASKWPSGGVETIKLLFKWEWAVLCQYQDIGGFVRDSVSVAPSRKEVRKIYARLRSDPHCRNVRIARRLVQSNWEPYTDSFGWNAGCGKR